ncbi:YcaO-like family protein [Rhizobium jaguaris]|uniref:YcaO-like family protein n=1 Tax=Rhizobium jaguaris TaxID=1312183 RepID=UPI0013C480E6|nr:YcaO-like family protein [Rhizobium jaguaris]
MEPLIVDRNQVDDMPFHSMTVTGRAVGGRQFSGAGIGQSCAASLWSTLGEGVERLCLASPPPDLPVGRAQDLPGQALTAEQWPLFTEEQLRAHDFPWSNLCEDLICRWSCGVRLLTGVPYWAPASLIWVDRHADRFTAGFSTGTACHTDPAQATLSAILEVVERDAFAILWEARACVPCLDPQAQWQRPMVRQLDRALAHRRQRLLLRDMTTDLGIPAVCAVIQDLQARRPALVVGTAADQTYEAACFRAASEAWFCWTWMRDQHRRDLNASFDRAWEETTVPKDMRAHAFLYGFPEAGFMAQHLTAPAFRFRSVAAETRSERPALATQLLIQKLEAAGFPVLEFQITLPEIAALGLVVHKVLVPKLTPLSIGRFCRALANSRIRTVPLCCGWSHHGVLPPAAAYPHPLP